MAINGLVCLLLVITSISDIRTRKISMKLLVVFGFIALAASLFLLKTSTVSIVQGIIPGIIILLLGRITGEGIGYGDGVLLIVIGLFLGINKTIEMILSALFVAAVYSVFLISCKKANRKKELPFVPLLLIAFIWMRFAK